MRCICIALAPSIEDIMTEEPERINKSFNGDIGDRCIACKKYHAKGYCHGESANQPDKLAINKSVVDEHLWSQAETTVLKWRGSWDAPGFDACVESEYKKLKEKLNAKTR